MDEPYRLGQCGGFSQQGLNDGIDAAFSAMSATDFQDYSIVIAAHGSRDPAGISECEALIKLMQARAPGRHIGHGYLEFASPTITEAVETMIEAGARRIVMLPALLFAATHAKNDMPSELAMLKHDFPDVAFHFGAALGLHPSLLRLSQQRIVDAEARSDRTAKRSDACLVVVGRGTTDPDANSEVSKLARMLEEGLGFGASFVCYAGTAQPAVADGLLTAARLGHQRIVVFPYFLFDGVLVKRISSAAEALKARYSQIEVIEVAHLGAHVSVADAFLERAQEGVEGRANMNCSLCKYRVQIVGFEEQVGTPQQAHHLRMRGVATKEADPVVAEPLWKSYEPHPIEAESFRIIELGHEWSAYAPTEKRVLQRLVHTSGDFSIVGDLYFSPGAVDTGARALLRCRRVVTDVTMVQTGLKRSLLDQLGIDTWCGVHDRESHLLARQNNMTRSAAGIQRAWQKWGNDVIVAIGDAPTALTETTRLIREHGWRPQLVIGLPVGFVGTRESKDDLRRCLQVPRITNTGTRGGSPWAASVVNALMIAALDSVAEADNA